MWDFPGSEELQRITRAIHERGGIVSSVCHGYCGLLNTRLADGTLLAAGRRVTGFSWREEVLAGVAAKMMQALRINPDVIDHCQNHVMKGSRVRRHYLHHDYADEKREAWRVLGTKLEEILAASGALS